MQLKTYTFLNYAIAGIIMVIFLYAVFSYPEKNKIQKCIHTELLGKKCPTCGMLDGFSAILRGHFNDANAIQPNSLKVFLFLLVQLLMRIKILMVLKKMSVPLKMMLSIDVIISLLFFILAFKNMIPQIFYIYYKMLLTGS
jgi:hypothetical protein